MPIARPPFHGYLHAMSNPRLRVIYLALLVIGVGWLVAWGGYRWADTRRVTPEKVAAFLRDHDLSRLAGKARSDALRGLAERLNKMSLDERRRSRMDREWQKWFDQMTDAERAEFIDRTTPVRVQQMLTSFEQLPDDRRKKAIDDAMRRLKQLRDGEMPPEEAANRPPVLSEDLRKRMVTSGLQSFYKSSSSQTKAELAPVIEEMQRMMESGILFRR